MTDNPRRSTPLKNKDAEPNLPEMPVEGSNAIQEIPEEVAQVLEGVPEEVREQILQVMEVMQVKTSQYSGPIPPPALFAEYEAAVKGSGDRIMKMAENEQAHRHKTETTMLENERFVLQEDKKLEGWGLLAAFTATIITILSGTHLLSIGRDAAGFAIILAQGAIIAGVFYYNQRKQQSAQKKVEEPPEKK